jgi:hypothetical protein
MTRKDYQKIAEILKRVKDAEDKKEPLCALYLAQITAHMLKQDNARFDGYRFSKAIGYDFNITL